MEQVLRVLGLNDVINSVGIREFPSVGRFDSPLPLIVSQRYMLPNVGLLESHGFIV